MPMDIKPYIDRAQEFLKKLSPQKTVANDDGQVPSVAEPSMMRGALSAASSLSKTLTGSVGSMGEFYFPPDVIGGSCPRVAGQEEEIVWNAAAETCDTERVHVVWNSTENKIWYLAVRSSELASRPDSWCPFATLLPGMKDSLPPPVCYTYYGDEMATMMTVTADGLQIYRGTNLVVRAKAERTARELGNATIHELIPDRILTLTPVPWYSLSLFEDRARRVLAAISVVVAIALTSISFLVWMFASMALIGSRHDLSAAMTRTEEKTTEMMNMAAQLRASPMREQLAAFADLNDGLLDLNGFLDVYEIKSGKIRWRAVVPNNVTADRIGALGGQTIESKAENEVIGNKAEIEFETSGVGKK